MCQSADDHNRCDEIKVETELNCSRHLNISNVCGLHMECWCHPPFGGVHEISITMPDKFQRMTLTLEPDPWNNTRTHITVPINGENQLAGTLETPTTIDFDVIRSKSISHIESSKEYGLQISYRDVKKIYTQDGTVNGEHTVKIRLFSTETVFIREILKKLSDITRIGTVLTYTMSVISGFRFIKLGCGHCIDKTCQKCTKDPPKDVKKRVSILEEQTYELRKVPVKKIGVSMESECKILECHVTGRKYKYNPVTKKSTWIEDITL